MARGDGKLFAAFDWVAKAGVSFNLVTDILRLGIVTNAIIPGVGTNDPRWGPGGGANFAAAQVATATSYTGPVILSGQTWIRSAGVNTLDFSDINWDIDLSGFTNAYYAIVYDDTVAGKYCYGYIDLGGPVSIAAVPLIISSPAGFSVDTAT